MSQIIYWYGRLPSQTFKDFQTLRTVNKEIQKVSFEVSAEYQSSELCTFKWRAGNYLADNIDDVGYIEVGHRGIYESAHRYTEIFFEF